MNLLEHRLRMVVHTCRTIGRTGRKVATSHAHVRSFRTKAQYRELGIFGSELAGNRQRQIVRSLFRFLFRSMNPANERNPEEREIPLISGISRFCSAL